MDRLGTKASLVAGLLACSFATSVMADVTPEQEYSKRLKAYQTISPGGDTPFGEQINLYTGEVTFSQTDIAFEGIGPTIVINRSQGDSQQDGANIPRGFGGWQISIPRIETLVKWDYPDSPGESWRVGISNTTARCTQYGKPHLAMDDWWHGIDLVAEDGSRRPLLKRATGNTQQPSMTDAGGQPMVFPALTADNWQISCLPTTANGEVGEAYLAISPDGTKYWLNHLVGDEASSVRERDPSALLITRMFVQMYATRIEDRFGNWVQYHYTGNKLTSITAKDGRSVSIAWRTDSPLIDKITVQPGATQRVWQYQYDGVSAVGGSLRYVVLPDASRWEFSSAGLAGDMNSAALVACTTRTSSGLVTPPATTSRTVVSPTGATGVFEFKATWHARSYMPSICEYDAAAHQYYETIPPVFGMYSLFKRTISGPGIAAQIWNYTYAPAQGSADRDACATAGNCVETAWVDTVDPAGHRTRQTFSTRWGVTEGRITRTDRYQGASTLLSSTVPTYSAPTAGPWPAKIGISGMGIKFNIDKLETWTPLNKRVITQQGTTYTWQANTFDIYANPLTTVRSSTPGGYTRSDTTAYHHNLNKWVMSQVASSTCTAPAGCASMVESKTDYDANALPWKTYSFGRLLQTMTYGADGTLATVKDGNNNTTTFSAWKRGIPQKITFADTKFKSAVVDDLGQITSVTDENTFTTKYGYDAMGRLNVIDYPDADTVNWANTSITFAKSASAIYGLTAGHWQQTINTGNGRQVAYFDALWRPVVISSYDAGDTADTLSQTVTRYDSGGRATFASYPQRTQDPAISGIQRAHTPTYRATFMARRSSSRGATAVPL